MVSDQAASPNSTTKRAAPSFVCLNLNDAQTLPNDQLISTISGTLVSQTPVFKTLPQRRLQRNHHRQQQKLKSSNGLEIDKMPLTSSPPLAMPNLLELATRSTHLPNLTTSTHSMDPSTMESSNKYSYETQIDSNGVNHHRLHSNIDHHPHSKNDTSPTRTTLGTSVKMPVVNHGSPRKSASEKRSNYSIQHTLSTIESVVKQRAMIITNENMHPPGAMDRVNHLLKEHYPPTTKK